MATETNELLLDADGLYSIYKGLEGANNVVALKGLNLDMKKGEFVAIVGTSGAGKSTLLRTLGGLQKPSAGEIRYFGRDISQMTEEALVPIRRSTIGFIFQEGNLIPELSAYNNVVRTLRYSGVGISEARKRAKELLKKLGMESRMHDLPQRLSGGELQRVAIARAISNNPALILADEPTGNLDAKNTEQVMQLFRDLHKELNIAFLIVTHSQHVASFADRSVELSDGMIIGQHNAGSDIYDLKESRSVIVSKSGNMTLPPEFLSALVAYGYHWDFTLDINANGPRIIGKPSLKTHNNCPVCNVPLKGDKFFCHSCGAKLN
ncbi:Vitamin B12 import ATP-binding protein BtuD [Candidatus Lokiarchaeum ossiferum]|uniref:Vitamin B12 import ATP-binding protein BtuD n=1 Tax=Candidatus Lokiarchaeum ossiferum TaxID=2951803 RepID=A0ABY6HY98_9ARCH|nr:Vitamin B12 import ATP-binding protein BtuD [Candidatus Lokiarchaeum sp. B-35]